MVSVPAEMLLQPLRLLTKEGKDIGELEQDIGKLLLNLMNTLSEHHEFIELQDLVTSIAKFNFLVFDEGTRDDLIKKMCQISNSATNINTVEKCLSFFDVIVSYLIEYSHFVFKIQSQFSISIYFKFVSSYQKNRLNLVPFLQ